MTRTWTKIIGVFSIAWLAGFATAQNWSRPYETGLSEAKRGNWVAAREAFKEAIGHRGQDSDKASQVGLSITDRRPWRDGAPYSPNFAAAYCAFKAAANAPDVTTRRDFLALAIAEFKALIENRQESAESLLFLAAALSAAERSQEASQVQERLMNADQSKLFKVDREVIDFDDMRVLSSVLQGTGGVDTVGMSLPSADNPFGIVPALDYKFALIVGVSDGGHAFATADVDLIKDTLARHAGYAEHRITALKNPTQAEFQSATAALAELLPEGATVLVYFTGPARQTNEGRDEVGLAGGSWIPKTDLYSKFVSRGASIFSFFQVDRRRESDGRVFGTDLPQTGRIVQCMGAAPGELATSVNYEDRMHGTYTAGFVQTLARMRNNRVAIGEFAWAVFDVVRKGGAGGAQTPTLPIYIGLGSTSRF